MVWQRAGTVSVQSGSTTVTGVNVAFAATSKVGDSFIGPDGSNYEVSNIASATVISILPAYKWATVSGAAYAIMPVQGYVKDSADQLRTATKALGDMPLSKQDKSDNLTAFSGLPGAADRLPYFTGQGVLSLAVISAKARALLARADSSGMRSEIGVDVTMASAVLDPQSAGGLMSVITVSGFTVFKYANGQMIVQGLIPTTPSIPANTQFTVSVAIPVTFPVGSVTLVGTVYPSVGNDFAIRNTQAPGSTAYLFCANGASAQTFSGNLMLVGRWK